MFFFLHLLSMGFVLPIDLEKWCSQIRLPFVFFLFPYFPGVLSVLIKVFVSISKKKINFSFSFVEYETNKPNLIFCVWQKWIDTNKHGDLIFSLNVTIVRLSTLLMWNFVCLFFFRFRSSQLIPATGYYFCLKCVTWEGFIERVAYSNLRSCQNINIRMVFFKIENSIFRVKFHCDLRFKFKSMN